MHELSIAHQLVELASAAAANAGIPHVSAVNLRLGMLSGVVADALEFGFEVAASGTPLAGAKLRIEIVPVLIYCATCQTTQPLPSIQCFRCPRCNTPTSQIVQGKELDLVALEYADEYSEATQ